MRRQILFISGVLFLLSSFSNVSADNSAAPTPQTLSSDQAAQKQRVQKPPADRVQLKLMNLTKLCDLTPEQQVKVKEIFTNIQPLRDKLNAEYQAKLKVLKDNERQALNSILTADQQAKLAAGFKRRPRPQVPQQSQPSQAPQPPKN